MRAIAFITTLAASFAANAALDGAVREGGKKFALRQGPSELAVYSTQVECETAARTKTSNPGSIRQRFEIRTGGGAVIATEASQVGCIARVVSRLTADAETRTEGGNVNSCVVQTSYSTAFQPPTCFSTFNYVARYTGTTTPPDPEPKPCPVCPPPTAVVCPTEPGVVNVIQACPNGTFGDGWTQTIRVYVGDPPTCAVTVLRTPVAAPTSQCTPIPTGAAALEWRPELWDTDGKPIMALGGYRIHYGRSASDLYKTIQISDAWRIRHMVTGLAPGNWYFAVREFTPEGNESALSNVVLKNIK